MRVYMCLSNLLIIVAGGHIVPTSFGLDSASSLGFLLVMFIWVLALVVIMYGVRVHAHVGLIS